MRRDDAKYLTLNIDKRFGFYSSILVYQSCRASRHVKFTHVDTNLEDVIPGIAFEPCSHWEIVKPRKMHISRVCFLSLPLSLSFTPHADRSTGFHPRISWKFYRVASTEFPGLVRNSTCASCASRVQVIRERGGVEKLFVEGENDTATWEKVEIGGCYIRNYVRLFWSVVDASWKCLFKVQRQV